MRRAGTRKDFLEAVSAIDMSSDARDHRVPGTHARSIDRRESKLARFIVLLTQFAMLFFTSICFGHNTCASSKGMLTIRHFQYLSVSIVPWSIL
jgi:hypothetical protein